MTPNTEPMLFGFGGIRQGMLAPVGLPNMTRRVFIDVRRQRKKIGSMYFERVYLVDTQIGTICHDPDAGPCGSWAYSTSFHDDFVTIENGSRTKAIRAILDDFAKGLAATDLGDWG